MSILVQIFEKSRFWSKCSKNLDFNGNFRKMSILVEIFEIVDLGRNIRQISILVEIFEKSGICSKFLKNLEFGRNLRKISHFVEIFEKSQI